MPTLNIFISHKLEDNIAAQDIKQELLRYSGSGIEVFLSSDIAYGENWLKVIQDKLIACNLLLLLFTDKKASWDWCLYEAGMFTRLDADSYKRVICLHSSDLDEPPGPLKHLQPLKATEPNILEFLKTLYRKNTYTPDSPPIAPYVKDQDLMSSARQIHAHLTKTPRDSQVLLKCMTLHIRDVNTISADQIHPNAEVEADKPSLELFGKNSGTWLWKDLVKDFNDADFRWMKQLAKAIYQASQRGAIEPVFATFTASAFTSGGNHRLYQPILNSVEWERDGSIRFQILFKEEVTWRLSDIPENLAVLHTAQHMALRFRYEVVRKYAHRLVLRGGASLDNVLSELHEVLHSIEQESSSRGLLEEHKLLKVFNKKGQITKVRKMYADWYAIRSKLHVALVQNAVEEIIQCLSRLEDLNNEFLPMAASRYTELMIEAISEEESALGEERSVHGEDRKDQLVSLTPKQSRKKKPQDNSSSVKKKVFRKIDITASKGIGVA